MVFLPTYNEEQNIGNTLGKIKSVINKRTTDVVVFDDCSIDNTAKIARDVGFEVITSKRNLGNGSVTKRAFTYALRLGYENVVKIDADGQHLPSFIPRVLSLLDSGASEFVICSRYHPSSERINEPPEGRRLVNIMITEAVNKLTDSNLTDVSSGFCGYTTKLLRRIRVKTKRYGAPVEIVIRARMLGYHITELPHPVIYLKSNNLIRIDQYIEIFSSLKDELKEFYF